jgi:nicotinamidase-related amidase/alkylated DNA repair dioxygenase AlkB
MPSRDEVAAKLPPLRTRDVLLVLDLTNDFLSLEAQLPVSEPPGFLENIKNLVPSFRDRADIVWVKSFLDTPRPVNVPGAERVILVTEKEDSRKKSPSPKRKGSDYKPSKKAYELLKSVGAKNLDPSEIEVNLGRERSKEREKGNETFLSRSPSGAAPTCCKPGTRGSEFADEIKSLIDSSRDSVLLKTNYSAFKSTSLLQSLRSNLIVNVYICGLLSNISVYATAVDAARHGFTVTLFEDCLGYRHKASHDEALRQMNDDMDVETIKSTSVIGASLPKHGKQKQVPKPLLEEALQSMTLEEGKNGRISEKSIDDTKKESSGSRVVTKEGRSGVITPDPDMDKTSLLAAIRKSPETAEGQARVRIKKATQKRDRRTQPSLGATAEPHNPTLARSSSEPDRQSEEVMLDSSESKPRSTSDTPAQPNKVLRTAKWRKRHPDPVLGPGDKIGEGDSRIVYNVLSPDLEESIFKKLREEVQWKSMYHRGGEVPRLVAVEGDIEADGSFPIYRHPADESPALSSFTPTVALIRDEIQKSLRQPLNHVLIQLYRSGQDYISEHSDKTLDIVRGSNIVNISIGAQRTMTLRTKKSAEESNEAHKETDQPKDKPAPSKVTVETSSEPVERNVQKIPMPHNSMFVLGQRTNMRWLHGIRQEKRPDNEKTEEELSYDGERISLTFRHIGTFLSSDQTHIWGQGAVSKMKQFAGDVVHGETPETEQMIRGFGKENHETAFDWDAEYGNGFDIVNFVVSRSAKLSYCASSLTGLRLELLFADRELPFDRVEQANSPCKSHKNKLLHRCFASYAKLVDSNDAQTEIEGELAIILYMHLSKAHLDSRMEPDKASPTELAETLNALGQGMALSQLLQLEASNSLKGLPQKEVVSKICNMLDAGQPYIAGSEIGMGDLACWPALCAVSAMGEQILVPKAQEYVRRVGETDTFRDILDRYEQFKPRLD